MDSLPRLPLLTAGSAYRIWCARTGIRIVRSTFYRWLDAGYVPCRRIGRNRIYIRWEDFEKTLRKAVD